MNGFKYHQDLFNRLINQQRSTQEKANEYLSKKKVFTITNLKKDLPVHQKIIAFKFLYELNRDIL